MTAVTDPYTTPGHISRDGHIAFASVQFNVTQTSIPTSEANALMQRRTGRVRARRDVLAWAATWWTRPRRPTAGSSDGIGIGAAAIVLLIAFGSLLAMGLPIVTAVFGIGCGLALIALLGHLFPAPEFAPIIASMIGLGVGVDYALFIVTRFRESLHAGMEPEGAAVHAMRTAGRSVLVAGITVVIGMMGLLVLRQSLMNGVAVAAAATVAMTVLGSLTLLPALLGFSGTRLAKPSRFGLPRRRSRAQASAPSHVRSGESAPSAAERWAAVVSRRPVVSAVLATAVILILAVPVLSMNLSMPDESAQASGTMGRASYLTMAEGFGPGFDAPLIVAASLPGTGDSTGTARLASAIGATPGIARITPPVTSPDGKAVMLIAYPTTGEQDPATNALVNRINNTVLPRATAGTGVTRLSHRPQRGQRRLRQHGLPAAAVADRGRHRARRCCCSRWCSGRSWSRSRRP